MAQIKAPAGGAGRIHFLDSARALFMLLGIPFHAALAYTAAPWLLQSPQTSALLEPLPLILSAFRMPGFFIIAGFFAALLLERRTPGEWLRTRMVRLGVPLLAGMALIVPVQNALFRYPVEGEALHMPSSAAGLLLSHLWFLPVLMMLCAGLAAVWFVVVRVRLTVPPVWLLGIVIGCWELSLRLLPGLTGIDLALLGGMIDVNSVLAYGPFFVVGVAMRRSEGLFARFTRFDRLTLFFGIAALIVHLVIGQPDTRLDVVLDQLTRAMAAVCIGQSLLAALCRWFDRPSPMVDRMIEASFSIYLFHHPIVIGLVVLLLQVPLPPLLEWAMVCLGTFGLSYAMHRGLRQSAILLFLFNGVGLRRGRGVLLRANAQPPR